MEKHKKEMGSVKFWRSQWQQQWQWKPEEEAEAEAGAEGEADTGTHRQWGCSHSRRKRKAALTKGVARRAATK